MRNSEITPTGENDGHSQDASVVPAAAGNQMTLVPREAYWIYWIPAFAEMTLIKERE